MPAAKKHLDLTGNGLNHPNDYGHRLYPAVIMHLIGGPPFTPRQVTIPASAAAFVVDGKLDEPAYTQPPLIESFVVAGAGQRKPPRTQAWIFWSPERLHLAFSCDDATLTALPATPRESDVNAQDRVEFFLGRGRLYEPYHCVEIAPRGAVHDYLARFYRQFDQGWAPAGMLVQTAITERGYQVEATLSRAALESMNVRLEAGHAFRLGLFRADFNSSEPHQPAWITWAEAGTPTPDFHVERAFGDALLGSP